MNLLQTINLIEAIASDQPPVNSIVRNDIYRLDSLPAVEYGVFSWLQGQHRTSIDSSLMFYDFTFFYVDRLTADHDNEIQIQSNGIEVLENILMALSDYGLVAGEHTFRTFNERFSDECAGVFVNVALEVPKEGICAQGFTFDRTIQTY